MDRPQTRDSLVEKCGRTCQCQCQTNQINGTTKCGQILQVTQTAMCRNHGIMPSSVKTLIGLAAPNINKFTAACHSVVPNNMESRTAGERWLSLGRHSTRDDDLFCQVSRISCFQKHRAATLRQPHSTKQTWRFPELADAMQHVVRHKQRSAVPQSTHSEPLASTSATARMFTELLSSCFK